MEQVEFQGFGGIALAATAFGSPENPPVLLLPSLGQVREFWFGSAKALAEAGRYAICVDLRGHGDSGHSPDGHYELDAYIGDLRAVLASLSSRAVVVSAGLGARVAMLAAGEGAPHLVTGLALVDTNIWVEQAVVDRLGGAMALRTASFDDPSKIVDAISAAYPNEPRPSLTERTMAAYAQGSDGQYAWRGDVRALAAASLPDLEERLSEAAARLAAPVTLIRGSLNETVSAEVTQRLCALIPGSEIAEIEGAGHYAASDREDDFNAILLDFLERKAPRQPLTFIRGSEPRVLRDALGCFGTGVTIVTTINEDGEPIGLTANSFTSVSLDPPLILFSLARSSANLETFEKAGKFAVNVLHIGQQPAAGRFATRGVARFEGIVWSQRDEGGSPLLEGSLASFDCTTHAIHDGGDHLMFVGHVDHATFEPHRDPLLYFRGKFRRLHFA
ncbi:alpha/beta fold hydrolase [Novosphingobium sp. MMS21-SN21R]|uniref:alpha/beta fold hydrolase n=1 Tax=Novosphingobium sp. MMS21-SN21R TaxID=2969298 RepID=UPI002883E3DD|nr:alpha/beta fold hydrolase [Novosphingobium sp. MMS21-SN21R]MDT0509783.1 alpha/beta fold hydrolase [Novosphingobium sp. MMS21-SN21R]